MTLGDQVKDIKAILDAFELTDEQRETIIREVTENYRTIAEVDRKAQRITELEEQNKALTEQVGNLEGEGEELEKLQAKVREFTEAEERRKSDEAEKAKRDTFKIVFDAALDGKEFANEIVRDSVFEKAFARCNEQTGMDAKAAISEFTKDVDGIWRNPQQDAKKMPGQGELSGNQDHEAKDAKQAIKDFMFGK